MKVPAQQPVVQPVPPMQKFVLPVIVCIALLATGFIAYKAWSMSQKPPVVVEEDVVVDLPPVDESIVVDVVKSKTKDSTVILTVKGMSSKMAMVGYELTFESAGIIQGITSGNKPVEVKNQDAFEREVYLGTCSKNVCKAYPGVKQISLALEFTDTSGKKSQFTKDFDL